jgi:hypothetical protein
MENVVPRDVNCCNNRGVGQRSSLVRAPKPHPLSHKESLYFLYMGLFLGFKNIR